MEPRTVARAIAAGRVVFGAACIVAPRKVLGPTAARAEGQLVWMARAFGVRDVVLGAGTLRSLGEGVGAGTDAGGWVAMSALADTADIANAGVFHRELGPQGLAATLALAVPAAAGGWWAARRLAATATLR